MYRLNQYEIASLISYSTIGSMPDEKLFAAAEKGELSDPRKRQSHVRRLLDEPPAKVYLEKFSGMWLDIEKLMSSSREDPSLTPEIRRQMIEETKTFVSHSFLDTQGSFSDFFTADYTYTRPELAAYYGMQDSQSSGLAKRQLDATRSGVLGHGSILASQSLFLESSPIKRGVFVRMQLLCQDLPPPPANVDTTIPPPIPGQSIRDRLKRHQSQGEQEDGANSCFSCHRFIDSIGFGLESFDFAGKHRTIYEHIGGVAIDSSGAVSNIEGLNAPSNHEFQTLPELGQILADSQSAKDCVVTQLYRYTYGVNNKRSDQCALDELNRSFAANGYSVRALIESFSASEFFIYRQ
ncbi:MAG: DUF1592 domain-containing protein [Oligoflexus sp.]